MNISELQYTGKAKVIMERLDSIILQNDKIDNAQFKKDCLMSDGTGSKDDLGLGDQIKSLEKGQQETADEIARIDNRGTVRTRMTADCIRSLGQVSRSSEEYDRLKNYLITLALLPVYRLRIKHQSKLIKGMLGFLPMTGRDYSAFRKSWQDVYGNPHVRG